MSDFIRMEGITKIYDNGVLANNNINFSIKKGEIHAIAGENGAGKSTVMKVLYGIEKADSGKIFIEGKEIAIKTPLDAIKRGIGMVHQHFMLVDSLKVYENIFLGVEKIKNIILDKALMIKKTEELAKKYNMKVNPLDVCGELPVGVKQKVEILKVLAKGAKMIILDEPTAVLTPIETQEFFRQLKKLKEDNCAICIITHKLKEIKQICDRVTILQNGIDKGVYQVKDISTKEISKLMVGKDVKLKLDKKSSSPKEVALEIDNLTVFDNEGKKAVNNISLNVRKGEIVCFAGVEGNGQRDTIRCITGLHNDYIGTIKINNRDIKKYSIKQIRDIGLAHIPEDRMTYGVNPSADIYDNIISYKTTQKQNTIFGFNKEKKLKADAKRLIADYNVKCRSHAQQIDMLSGGNIQKVVVAREVDSNPDLLIADQPTRGVDVGAIEFIHKKLIQLRDENKAILLVSADLSEVFNLADKILVFNNGEITGSFTDIKNLTDIEIGEYMLGIKKMTKQEIEKVNNG